MAGRDEDKAYGIPDALWEQVKPLLLPELPGPNDGQQMDDRQAMDAILYVLRTGCKWSGIPRDLGAGSIVHKRFQEWREAGLFQRMWRTGLLTYDDLRTLIWHGRRRRES